MGNTTTPSSVEESSHKYLYVILPVGVTAIAVAAYFLYKYVRNQPRNRKAFSQENFETELNQLKSYFPPQNYETWLKISMTVRPLLEEQEPRRPGVLLLIKSNKYDYTQLETHLASSVNGALLADRDYLEVDDDYLNDSQKSITEIFEAFEYHFANGGKVAIVRNIDQVRSPDVLNLFHSMCDNDYARHKRVTFIFTASLPQYAALGYHQQSPDEVRNTIFNEKWAHVSADKRRALVARIGPSTTLWS